MTIEENSGTSTAELEVSAQQPAPGADDKKPTVPASDADEQNPEAQETPEQQEAKRESRRARSNARKAQALADARAEAKLLREDRDRLNAKLEAQSKTQTETGEPQRNGVNPKTGTEYTFEEYLEARADWRADQRVDSRLKTEREAQQGKEKQQQEKAGTEKVAKAWAERETSFQTTTKDYESVVTPFLDDELSKLSSQARKLIVESDVGPGLLYQLAKLADSNSDEFDRIADLSPERQIVELGKLEGKVSGTAKKTTSAPAPANTTSGGRTASKDLAKMTQAEYEEHRKTQGARWAR